MRISLNPYISNPKYTKKQPKAPVFQGNIPNRNVFELSDVLHNIDLHSLENLFPKIRKNYSHLDINAVDQAGNTLITRAGSRSDWRLLRALDILEDNQIIQNIDWNKTDRINKNNFLTAALCTTKEYNDNTASLISFTDTLVKKGKFDINAYLPSSNCTALEIAMAINSPHISDLLAIESLDTMRSTHGNVPLIEAAIAGEIPAKDFEALLKHPSMELSKYPVRYIESLYDITNLIDPYKASMYRTALDRGMDQIPYRKIKNFYEQNGYLTFEQVQEYVKNVKYRDILNKPINDIGENILHILAENEISPDKEIALERLFDTLRDKGFQFSQKDILDRTPINIAIEAENNVYKKAFMNCIQKEFKEIKNQIHAINNSFDNYRFPSDNKNSILDVLL